MIPCRAVLHELPGTQTPRRESCIPGAAFDYRTACLANCLCGSGKEVIVTDRRAAGWFGQCAPDDDDDVFLRVHVICWPKMPRASKAPSLMVPAASGIGHNM